MVELRWRIQAIQTSEFFFVVAECSVKPFDDVDVFVTECQFGMSRTIS